MYCCCSLFNDRCMSAITIRKQNSAHLKHSGIHRHTHAETHENVWYEMTNKKNGNSSTSKPDPVMLWSYLICRFAAAYTYVQIHVWHIRSRSKCTDTGHAHTQPVRWLWLSHDIAFSNECWMLKKWKKIKISRTSTNSKRQQQHCT